MLCVCVCANAGVCVCAARSLLELAEHQEHRLDMFLSLVRVAGLQEWLSGPGELTFFAPTDDAFTRKRHTKKHLRCDGRVWSCDHCSSRLLWMASYLAVRHESPSRLRQHAYHP